MKHILRISPATFFLCRSNLAEINVYTSKQKKSLTSCHWQKVNGGLIPKQIFQQFNVQLSKVVHFSFAKNPFENLWKALVSQQLQKRTSPEGKKSSWIFNVFWIKSINNIREHFCLVGRRLNKKLLNGYLNNLLNRCVVATQE